MDPDYELTERVKQQAKEREAKDKNESIEKIKTIINNEFKKEIEMREIQLEQIQNKLTQAAKTLHLLRYVLVTSYYNKNDLQVPPTEEEVVQNNHIDKQSRIHPAIKKLLSNNSSVLPLNRRKSTRKNNNFVIQESQEDTLKQTVETINVVNSAASSSEKKITIPNGVASVRNRQMVKRRVIVGNISKWMPSESADDNSTHKWMVYVRGPKDNASIDDFVQKVVFYLHPSYQPNDVIELKDPPFHLSRRGWGEFPLRVQIFFHSRQNKPVDIIHNLKLDRTYTGRQTLGNETVVDLTVYSDRFSEKTEPFVEEFPSPKIKKESNNYQNYENFSFTHTKDEIDIEKHPILEEDVEVKGLGNALVDHTYSIMTDGPDDLQSYNPPTEPTIITSDGKLMYLKKRKRFQESLLKCNFEKRIKMESPEQILIDYNKYKIDFPSHRFRNILQALPFLLKRLTLITPLADDLDYKCTYPYVAKNFEVYSSWPVEKRMSSEWSRAKTIKRILAASNLKRKELWTTKMILAYARAHGYTDLTNYNMFKLKTYDEFLLGLDDNLSTNITPKITKMENDVNITDCNDDEPSIKKTVLTLTDPNINGSCTYVKQAALDVGVILKPEEIISGVLYNASQRVILEAAKCLAENLIRNARALIVYKDDFEENSSVIGVEEVRKVLNKHRPEFKHILNFNKELIKY